MTVIEYSAALIKYFSANDCLYLAASGVDDFSKVILISENKSKDIAGLEAALSSLEQAELVKKQVDKKGTYWILNKPFTSYEQTVVIDSQLALSIAEVINNFCENQSDRTDVCDPSKISQKEIRNLVLLIIYYYNKLNGQPTI